ncbi:MAG: spermine synthase [Opitutales bacterium]
MKPRHLLAETRTPDGGRLTLYAHDGQFQILLDGRELMHSFTTTSEVEMGERVSRHLRGRPAPRYLIGGLGLGFTLRAVLADLPADGRVTVAELLPAVVDWNRAHLRALNGALLDDPRVEVHTGDVGALLAASEAAAYDGILLDVDNGPTAMVQANNAALYEDPSLQRLKRALRPGGQIAFWSASADAAFAKRLRRTGFAIEAVPTRAYPAAKRPSYIVYYAVAR